jgi:hypothetical protein
LNLLVLKPARAQVQVEDQVNDEQMFASLDKRQMDDEDWFTTIG